MKDTLLIFKICHKNKKMKISASGLICFSSSVFSYRSDNHRHRVNYYSSMTAIFNGMATGNINANNHLVLEMTKIRNAAIGDESSTCGRKKSCSEMVKWSCSFFSLVWEYEALDNYVKSIHIDTNQDLVSSFLDIF